jgi:hypothetical protein
MRLVTGTCPNTLRALSREAELLLWMHVVGPAAADRARRAVPTDSLPPSPTTTTTTNQLAKKLPVGLQGPGMELPMAVISPSRQPRLLQR